MTTTTSRKLASPMLTVCLVPVFQGQLVAFDVSAPEARGKWLPWTVLEYGQSPWECASLLGVEWCDGQIEAIKLVDTISIPGPDNRWHLALVFRAELTCMPTAQSGRSPEVMAEGAIVLSNPFAVPDVARWVSGEDTPSTKSPRQATPLLF